MIKYKLISRDDKKTEKIVTLKEMAKITGFSLSWLRRKLYFGDRIDGFEVYQANITFILQRKSKYTYFEWKSIVKARNMSEMVDLSGRCNDWFNNYHDLLVSEEGLQNKSKKSAWRLIERIEWEKVCW